MLGHRMLLGGVKPGAPGTVGVVDDFNRPNQSLLGTSSGGKPWTMYGTAGLAVESNSCMWQRRSYTGRRIEAIDVGAADMDCTFTVQMASWGLGWVLRNEPSAGWTAASANTGLQFQFSTFNNGFTFTETLNGTAHQSFAVANTLTLGTHTFRTVVSGSNLTLTVDGSVLLNATLLTTGQGGTHFAFRITDTTASGTAVKSYLDNLVIS